MTAQDKNKPVYKSRTFWSLIVVFIIQMLQQFNVPTGIDPATQESIITIMTMLGGSAAVWFSRITKHDPTKNY